MGWGGQEVRMNPSFRLKHLGTQDCHLSWGRLRGTVSRGRNQSFILDMLTWKGDWWTSHHPEWQVTLFASFSTFS